MIRSTPGQIRLGKHRAGVDDDGRLPTRDGHHVEAELAEAAKRHDIDWRRAAGPRRPSTRSSNPSQARACRHDASNVAGTTAAAPGRGARLAGSGRWERLENEAGSRGNYSTAHAYGAVGEARPGEANSASSQRLGPALRVDSGRRQHAAASRRRVRRTASARWTVFRRCVNTRAPSSNSSGSRMSTCGGRKVEPDDGRPNLRRRPKRAGRQRQHAVTSAPARSGRSARRTRRCRARPADRRPLFCSISVASRTPPSRRERRAAEQDRRRDVVGQVADDATCSPAIGRRAPSHAVSNPRGRRRARRR